MYLSYDKANKFLINVKGVHNLPGQTNNSTITKYWNDLIKRLQIRLGDYSFRKLTSKLCLPQGRTTFQLLFI